MTFIRRTDRGLLANWWFTVDRALLAVFFLLMAIGLLANMASSPAVAVRLDLQPFHFVKRQIVFLIPAIAALLAASLLTVRAARRVAIAVFAVSLTLTVLTLQIGDEVKGAFRWLNVGGFALQPSEFLKPAFVVVCALFFAEKIRRTDMPGNAVAAALLGICVVPLVSQPDFGQTILLCAVWALMLFATGISRTWIAGVTALGAGGLTAAYLTAPHVASRIDRYLHPEQGDTYQVGKARDAFRDGGAIGTGPGGGNVKQTVPEAHSDFVFAVIGEEFGALACIALSALFCFVVVRGLRRAADEEDPFRRLAVTGLISLFGLQAVINMGVNVALLPAKGMTLPFVSYGGSSLLSMAFAMGLALCFTRRRAVGKALDELPAAQAAGPRPARG